MVVFVAKGYRWIPHCLVKLDFLSIRKVFFNHFHVRFVETATYNHYCDDKVQKSCSIKNESQVAKIRFTYHIILTSESNKLKNKREIEKTGCDRLFDYTI